MLDILIKVNETIDIIDQSDLVVRLKQLKKEIDNHDEIRPLFQKFRIAKKEYEKDLVITDKLIKAKENLYNHPLIYEYRKLYSELNHSFFLFNSKISKLLDYKSCSTEAI